PFFGFGLGGGFAAGITFAIIPIMIFLVVTYILARSVESNPDKDARFNTAFYVAIGLDVFMIVTSFYWYLPARLLFGALLWLSSGNIISFLTGPYIAYARVITGEDKAHLQPM